ncbi:MAG: acyl-CoA synthetase [Robiginitomaculum sp.]|nr:MAG: acyl-CoA synthetase [Robiginitomaculum sp.]
MNHPSSHAQITPNKPAYIMAGSGEVVTYRNLDQRSAQGGELFKQLGLMPGDHIALFMENNARFFEIVWAAQRSGLIFTAISSHLEAAEVSYILTNCDAKVLITSAACRNTAQAALKGFDRKLEKYIVLGEADGFQSWENSIQGLSPVAAVDESAGVHMLYSSGTTGSPKGVYPTWMPGRDIDYMEPGMAALRDFFRINSETVYLSPAPLYHAAPLIFNQLVMFQGGTSIIMESFDAEQSLALIEKWKITTAQFVPIMFIRMLKLDKQIRNSYDLSSLKIAIHAAAPCPVEVKRQMIDWWGEIVFEYYSSTENAGATLLSAAQWLEHPGSVGFPLGCSIHIMDEEGSELGPNEVGEVYFENPALNFEYYKEPEKTAETRNLNGWVTVGDIGYVDDAGFLYLSDRKHFMIISGGVNIYPQEIENILIMHPDVADVAVFGIPNADFGQEIKAVVQPSVVGFNADELERSLQEWCVGKLSKIKRPRSISFDPSLPRLDNGKLYKKQIAETYQ